MITDADLFVCPLNLQPLIATPAANATAENLQDASPPALSRTANIQPRKAQCGPNRRERKNQ